MPTPLITLLTDFGNADAYLAMLRGVLLQSCPEARLVDISHHLPARPVFAAAFLLRRVYSYYPAGTIHLVGIDDGRGRRRALAAHAAGQFFLAADNGMLGLVLERDPGTVHAAPLDAPTTFLARDVLALWAARLVCGQDLASLGPVVEDWERLRLPRPHLRPDGLHGQVLHADPFGNLLLNIVPADLPPGLAGDRGTLELAGRRIHSWCPGYAQAPPGELFLLWGAEGWLEVSRAQGSAAADLQVGAGQNAVLR